MCPQRIARQALRVGLLAALVVLALSACGGGGQAESTVIREGDEADRIGDFEHQRLRALVEADMEVARQLHADDFQLINPSETRSQRKNTSGQWHPAISTTLCGSPMP
jgi:hypothetical protein